MNNNPSGNATYPVPSKGRKAVVMAESIEQRALFQWAEVMEGKYPFLRLLFHVPNGGLRNKKVAAQLKAEGVKPGVPDLFLPVARQGFHGLWIEMKAGSNKPTDYQKAWLSDLKIQGYKTAVCYTWGEATEVIEDYLGANSC